MFDLYRPPTSDGRTNTATGLKPLQEFLGANASPRIHSQLHFANLLVDLLHEVDHEIDQLVFVHLLRVEVGDQEADVVALDRFPAQNDKVLGSHHHEPGELVAENFLDFVGLLDGDADPDGVDARLDQDALLFVARNDDRIEEEFLAAPHLDLGFIVSLDDLRREVDETHRGGQCVPHSGQIGLEGGGHFGRGHSGWLMVSG